MDGIAESRPDMNIKVAAYTVTHLPNYIELDFIPEQRQLNKLSFLSLNVCGIMQKLNFPEFITLIRTYDIIGLQETKTDDYDTIDVTGYKVFLKNRSCTSKN